MDKKDTDSASGPVSSSSVVMKAIDAKTFTEMEAFVKDLEGRPIERLLRDLAHLATLSGAKVSLVSYVVAAKYKQSDPAGRSLIRDSITATMEQVEAGEQRERLTSMMERMR